MSEEVTWIKEAAHAYRSIVLCVGELDSSIRDIENAVDARRVNVCGSKTPTIANTEISKKEAIKHKVRR